MKNSTTDIIIGILWIIAAIMNTILLGWKSFAFWFAVPVIWAYIMKCRNYEEIIKVYETKIIKLTNERRKKK